MAEEYKKIDVEALKNGSLNVKDIKLEDLIRDAIARKDEKAYEWACEQLDAKVISGKRGEIAKPIRTIRNEYFDMFLGVKTGKGKSAYQRKKEKEYKKISELIEKTKKIFENK